MRATALRAMGTTYATRVAGQAMSALMAGLLAIGVLAVIRSAPANLLEPPAIASEMAGQPAVDATERRALGAYQSLPLSFIPNAGQTDARVRYYAAGPDYSFLFTKQEVALSFGDGATGGYALDLHFMGASPEAHLEAASLQPGRVNYLTGSDPSAWQRGLPTYGGVVYRDLWPGIDMTFKGTGGQLKYEFLVQPGASPSDIRLAYAGAESLSVGGQGDLLVHTGTRTITDTRPVSHQHIGGRTTPVASSYLLTGGLGYGFEVGAYDPRIPLTIDPGLQYSTFIGGGLNDEGTGIFVEGGKAFVTGQTHSPDYPTTPGAFDQVYGPGADVFVTKLDTSGSQLIYSTFIGGTVVGGGIDVGEDIFVKNGEAYVTGETFSTDFPTTPGAWDNSHNGLDDGFALKLNSSGRALVFSTFLGGTLGDQGRGIDVYQDRTYVTGVTFSPTFPTTPGAWDTIHNGTNDAFVTRLNANGSALEYSTFLGGPFSEEGQDVAVEDRKAYVTGFTESSTFPTTPGAHDDNHNGLRDVFVTKLNATGSALDYSTFLGGTMDDEGFGIAVESDEAYLTGVTESGNFRTTAGAYDDDYNGGLGDAFVAKVNRAGSRLVYSTYLGGDNFDLSEEIVVRGGKAYVAGQTNSPNFPVTDNAFDQSYEGGIRDAFITKLNGTGSALEYSTYLGGGARDQARDIAVSGEEMFVTGFTTSIDFPTTPGAWDNIQNGNRDVFVTKLTPE